MSDIKRKTKVYGSQHYIHTRSSGLLDEECEREMEQEQEEEEEKEVPRVTPAGETDWATSKDLAATSPLMLPAAAGVMSLSTAASKLSKMAIHRLSWSSRVFCTRNFVHSVAASTCLDEYMRQVDFIAVFPGANPNSSGPRHQLLLLSEREADTLLALLWTTSSRSEAGRSAAPFELVNRVQLWHMLLTDGGAEVETLPAVAWRMLLAVARQQQRACCCLADIGDKRELLKDMVSVQVFNGDTMYSAGQQQWESQVSDSVQGVELQRLVKRKHGVMEDLVWMRGKQSLFSHSHLQEACD